MAITTGTVAARLAARLRAAGVDMTDAQAAAFATAFAGDLEEWTGGAEAVPVALANRVSETATAWNTDVMQRLDWWTGPADGGPNGDGLYPMTNAAGVVTMFPSLAKLVSSTAKGDTGWSAKTTIEPDGEMRAVVRILDWIGGEGTKPATGYIAEDGSLVGTAAAARDVFSAISSTLTGLKDDAEAALGGAVAARIAAEAARDDGTVTTYLATGATDSIPTIFRFEDGRVPAYFDDEGKFHVPGGLFAADLDFMKVTKVRNIDGISTVLTDETGQYALGVIGVDGEWTFFNRAPDDKPSTLSLSFERGADVDGVSTVLTDGSGLYALAVIGEDGEWTHFKQADGGGGGGTANALSYESGAAIEDISVVITDKSGVYVLAVISDSGEWTYYRSAPTSAPAVAAPVKRSAVMDFDFIADCMWSEWVYPIAVEAHGDTLIGALGTGLGASGRVAPLTVNQSLWGGRFEKVQFDSVASGVIDDHNAPNLLVDPRPAARAPLQVFQNDHSGPGSNLRQWRSKTMDARGLGAANRLTSTGQRTYSQSFRVPATPDTIVQFNRCAVNAGFPTWEFRLSLDDGENFSAPVNVFIGNEVYVLARPALDGSGLHLVGYVHPLGGGDHRIVYLFLRYSDWALLRPDSATPLVPNIWAMSAPITPTANGNGYVLQTPAAGLTSRLSGAFETSPGVLEVVWSEFVIGDSANNYATGRYRHAVVNLSGGPSVSVTEIGPSGQPIESPMGTSEYIAGAEICGPLEVVAAAWSISGNGKGRLSRYRRVSGVWEETVVLDLPGVKSARPRPIISQTWNHTTQRIESALTRRCAYWRGSYSAFGIYDADAHILDLETI